MTSRRARVAAARWPWRHGVGEFESFARPRTVELLWRARASKI
jgi:hypothetical protein